MNVVLIMVSSINGKITNGKERDASSWTSSEDQALFKSLKSQFPVLVTGRNTFESVQSQIVPTPQLRRIIMTHTPGRFASITIPGQLEFTDEPPRTLVQRLTDEGYTSLLLAGGTQINTQFLSAHLVNEIHMTLEPKILKLGKPFVEQLDVQTDLKLISIKQLNAKGTLHLTYTVL